MEFDDLLSLKSVWTDNTRQLTCSQSIYELALMCVCLFPLPPPICFVLFPALWNIKIRTVSLKYFKNILYKNSIQINKRLLTHCWIVCFWKPICVQYFKLISLWFILPWYVRVKNARTRFNRFFNFIRKSILDCFEMFSNNKTY